MVQQAKSEGITINVRHAKILFCGASRAGKTCFSRLLRNKSYKNSESTPAGHTKQVLIAGKVNVVGSEWVNLESDSETQALTEKLQLILQYKNDTKEDKSPVDNREKVKPTVNDVSNTDSKIYNERTTNNVQLSNQFIKEPTYSDIASDPISKVNEGVSKDQNPLPKTDKRLPIISESTNKSQNNSEQSHNSTEVAMTNYHFLELKESMPKTWDLFTLLDTAGQPEFINMLPAINSSTAITFIILNLSDGEDGLENPIEAKFERRGYDKDEYKHTLGYSYKDLLKCLLSSVKVAALKKDDFHPEIIKRIKEDEHPEPEVYIIGTCADVLKEKWQKGYDQEIQKIDEKIKRLVNVIEQDDKIVFTSNVVTERYLNPIDNRAPRVHKDKICHDDPAIQTIQRETSDFISNIRQRLNEILWAKAQYEIPISWFILELELRKNYKVCIPLTEVQQICNNIMPSHRQMTLEQITQVLKFYHQYGMLLYFDEVDGMKDFVITNPQWLFTNLTKIIMCKYEHNATTLYGGNSIKRMQNGICDMKLLGKLTKELDFQGIQLISFLELLVHLKVIAPMDNGYFIPIILPVCTNTETMFTEKEYGMATVSIDDKDSVEVEPLLIQFTFGTIPRGLFGFLVVELLQQNSPGGSESEIYIPHGQNDVNNNKLFRCANVITFHVEPCFYISLIDKISYLELQVKATDNEPSCHCKAQRRVTKALEKVCDRFNWSFNNYCYGFKCQSKITHGSQSVHLALLDPDKSFAAKFAHCEYGYSTKLSEAHHVWFKV